MARALAEEGPGKRIAMPIQTDCPPSTREAFRCTGQQFDAIVRFAEERGLEHQPLEFVVALWCRLQPPSL
jgi:hypothetical protein